MPATVSLLSQSTPRKRKLTDDEYKPSKKSKPSAAAILSTRNNEDCIDRLLIEVNHPIIIGRHPTSDYVIKDKTVSSKHCVFHAVQADTGKVSIVCQDFSTNGIVVNGHAFVGKHSILVMDGDKIRIPGSQTFICEYTTPQWTQATQLTQTIPKTVGHYIITRTKLGSGAYSSVNLAVNSDAHRQVACKTIIRKTQADIEDILKEVELLRKLRHPNINAVYGFEMTGAHLHIFLELATGGDLFSYLAKYGSLCEGESKYITFQLMKGLKYLHQKTISHRDLKPENILLANPGSYPRVLIADFGLAKERAFEFTGNVAGTVSYLPPEAVNALARKEKYCAEASDSWALGLIIFIMLQGVHPFDSRYEGTQQSQYPVDNLGRLVAPAHSEELVRRRIMQKRLSFRYEDWSGLSIASDLISSLLVRDPAERQTIVGAMEHDWIKLDLVSLTKAYSRLVEQT